MRIAVTLIAVASIFHQATLHAEPAAPNIVFVLFDDMGWGQPQSYNADSALRTPNLDRLTREGMRFTDAHTAAAVCTPTRYGVLTGRYPARIGQFNVLTTYSKPIIPTSRMTVASMLKQQGYNTACIGKWHLGMNWEDGKPGNEKEVPIGSKMTEGPNALGFDYFYGFTHARNIGSIIEQDKVVAIVKDVDNQPLMIDKAVSWIGEQSKADKPFFLYFPMCPPHEPVVPSPEYTGKSQAIDVVGKNPQYGDWVYQGDAMLGRILEALDRANVSARTLVIATSDNGAEHRAYEPLRDSKRSIYEGGHRVPFVARWPGKIKPHSVNEHTICLNDFMSTAAEIVNVKIPDNAGEDSVSILSELVGTNASPAREATIHQSSKGDLALRQGRWKLVVMKDGDRELYNLETDLSEKSNVLDSNQSVAAKLLDVMHRDIDRGRSTPGASQKNDFDLVISSDGTSAAKPKRNQKKSASKN